MVRSGIRRHVTWAVVAAWLSGCAPAGPTIDWSKPIAQLPPDLVTEVPTHTPRDEAVHAGMAALTAGNYPEASRQFNLALKFEPQNSALHFLNGLTYQLMVAKGDEQKAAMAEDAYLLALRFDPQNYLASYQLGQLYLEKGDYARAQSYLADAVLWQRNNAEAYQSLAVASYYNRDVGLALWSSNNAKRLAPTDPAVLRTAAFVETVAGLDEQAAQDGKGYAATNPPEIRLAAFNARLAQLRASRGDAIEVAQARPKVPAAPPSFPQAPSGGLPAAPSPFGPPGFGPAPGGAAPGAPPFGATPGAPGAAATSAAAGPASTPWFDCGTGTATGGGGTTGYSSYGSSFGGGSSPQGDEPVALSALPSPCKGAEAPRMTLIDVVLIRTEESESSANGVNLLDGLQTVLNGSIVRSHTSGTSPAVTRTNAISLAFGNTTTTGIAYSLNIANAAHATNQIIARPTLVALDRQPSQFFSGSNVSIALTGQYGGNVVEKPIGVSLSITPTFVDDDTMLMTVKAARSFFETQVTGSGSIAQSLETTRNMVQANVVLKFGQTLILSGLNEKQNQTTGDGVPLLRDIPGLEYLFSARQTNNFSKSVMILITPRRPAYGDQLPPPVDRLAARPSLKELRDRASKALAPNSNLEVIAHSLNINPHYLAYRSGDVKSEYWIEPRSLSRTLHEALGLLYF